MSPETYQERRHRYWRNLMLAGRELFRVMPSSGGLVWLAFVLVFRGDSTRAMGWAATKILNHLRAYCFIDRPIIGGLAGTDASPFLLGVREGRRQAFLEFTRILNLDENDVRKLKEQGDE